MGIEKARQIASGPDRVSGGPLQFQEQHLFIAHPACSPEDSFGRRVDRLDETEETAEVLDVSPDTVKRDWRLAKLWLLRELEGEGR